MTQNIGENMEKDEKDPVIDSLINQIKSNYMENVGIDELIEFETKVASEDQMMEAAIESGADDVATSDDGHEVVTSMESLRDVAKALEDKFGEPRKAGLVWRPQNYIAVDDEAGEKIMKLLDTLEENDDVQRVFSNAEFSDAFMAKLGG